MDNQYIALILFAGIAVFLVIRLRGVLGRRTGTERQRIVFPQQRPDGFGPPDARRPPLPQGSGQVVDLRPNPTPGPQTPLGAGIARVQAADPNFRVDGFLTGARGAFEMIVKAFAEGDTAGLRRLVSDEVYDTFAEVIRHRLAEKESVVSRIVRLDTPELLAAEVEGRTARVTVKFVSAQISAVRAADGRMLEGDPEHPAERTDIWVFARNTRSSDPNWSLVATDAVV
jgi:predicted lipid-binding transport protein (Tim44 family)